MQTCTHARHCNSQVDLHREGLTPGNALELAGSYDVIVDATDNAPARFLLSDACAVLNRPLVSGAALGTDGQLTVYCHGPDGARALPTPDTALLSSCLPSHPPHAVEWCALDALHLMSFFRTD